MEQLAALQRDAQRELGRARTEEAARAQHGTARDQADSSPAWKGLLDATSAAEDALKLARVLLPELEPDPDPEPEPEPESEPEPEPELSTQTMEQHDDCSGLRVEELLAHRNRKGDTREPILEPMPRMCKFGDCGRGVTLIGDPGKPKLSAQCECGPSCIISMQSSVDHVLAWTLRICGDTQHPAVSIGAVPDEFRLDLDRAPTDPRWIVTSAAGAAPGTHLIQVKPGDSFAVVADMTRSRLTIHQQSAQVGNVQNHVEQRPTGWKCVLDTSTLRGSIRLCVCLYGVAVVELLKMRWSGTGDALQRRYEAALATLEPALGPADPTVLSTQHNLASIYMNLGWHEPVEPGARPPLLSKAERLMGLAFVGRSVVLGEDHLHTRKSSQSLRQIQHRSWTVQLEAIYSVYNPRKLCDIHALLKQHAGREAQLLQVVKRKYRVRTAVDRRSQEAAAKKAATEEETAVIADRFLSEISQREEAAAAANQKRAEEIVAFERAAEAAALAASQRLQKLAMRRKQKALRKEVEAGRPPVEERKQARAALAAASTLLSPQRIDQEQFNTPERQQQEQSFLQMPPPHIADGSAGVGDLTLANNQHHSSVFPPIKPALTCEQDRSILHMKEWALKVEKFAPRVHGSRTMYM
eukprot:COSAG02_NODE_578_length_20075_cov_93.607930_4_plen_639_part_00